jgi:serine/threonine protein phosphatase PrpC
MHVQFFSEKGNRPENEDFVLSATLNETTSIHIVADGMGGYEHGALAAKTVANTIVDSVKKNLCIGDNIESIIQNATNLSNTAIQKLRTEYNSKMGSTIAGILIADNQAYCFWVGDVRIYHFRDNKIKFQSKDHSLINELANNGQILSPTEIQKYRHFVTNSIQGNFEAIPEITVIKEIEDNDTFIICTDGVHGLIDSDELKCLLLSTAVNNAFISTIKEKCNKEGTDNSSMILIKMIGKE